MSAAQTAHQHIRNHEYWGIVMRTKNKLAILAAATLTLPASALAGDFTFNLGVTSDYKFRGQSQSQTNPAVFGGVDYVDESGFFAGAWASSVDFNDVADTYMELDLYAGYTHAFTDATSGTVKLVYYLYPTADYPPGSNDYDYLELVASLSHNFGPVTGGLEIAYSPDYFFESDTGVALTGSLSAPLVDSWWVFDGGIAASAKLGYQWIDDNTNFGTPDYLFYDVGLTAKISKLALDIRYVDSDLSDAECFGGTNLCEPKVVATLTLYLP
jgi:uncharacterized protein (TIGR02001 family)